MLLFLATLVDTALAYVAKSNVFNATVAQDLIARFKAHHPGTEMPFPEYVSLVPPPVLRDIHEFVASRYVRPVCMYTGWGRHYEGGGEGLGAHFDDREFDELSVVVQLSPGAFLFIVQGEGQEHNELETPRNGPVHLSKGRHAVSEDQTSEKTSVCP